MANTPFRRHKTWVHEGRISTPFIVHWPKGIANPGLRSAPGHVIDIVPTVLEAAGGKPPSAPGLSLVPLFKSDGELKRDFIWWQHEGNRALRVDEWKIVAAGKEASWELYDLKNDRSETNDLSRKFPDRVRAMATLWEKQTAAYAEQAKQDVK